MCFECLLAITLLSRFDSFSYFYIMEFFSFSFFLDLLITAEMILDCSLITLCLHRIAC